jgi:hypothetical protein
MFDKFLTDFPLSVYVSLTEPLPSETELNKLIEVIQKSDSSTGYIISVNDATPVFKQLRDLGQSNVLVRSGFIPHRALLKDPRLNIVMNYCGFNHALEAIYFGVPILGIP